MTPQILKLAFLSSRFPAWQKGQDKNFDILRMKRAFIMKVGHLGHLKESFIFEAVANF